MSPPLGYFILLLFLVFKSRESGGRLNFTMLSLILGIRVTRESQVLPPSFYDFCSSNQGKVDHVSAIIARFLWLGHSSHQKLEEVSTIIIVFLLLSAVKLGESGGPLN